MRIVHLTNAYSTRSGGIRTTAHCLGTGYRHRGHDFVLVVPGIRTIVEEHAWGTLVRLPGVRVPWTGGYRALIDLPQVRRLLDHLEPDRIEISDRFTLRPVGVWAAAAGVPSVMIAHERLDGLLRTIGHVPEPMAQRLADRHNRATAGAVDTVVATTRFAAVEFSRIDVPVTLVPLGVDLERFVPQTSGVPVPGRPPRLVLCSRLSREKRPDLAVEAVRVLRERGLEIDLVIAGDGPDVPALRRRAHDLPVTFLGHLPDRDAVAHLLASADIALAPGPIETFGLAALEALASGTPVVASATSAVAELATGGAGACADPTASGFADAIQRVLARPRELSRRAARERAQEFPWSRTVERLLEVHACPTTGAVR